MTGLQSYATNTAGAPQIAMLDLSVDPPERVLMDYGLGAEAFERHPERWRPEHMPDADHAAAVVEFQKLYPPTKPAL